MTQFTLPVLATREYTFRERGPHPKRPTTTVTVQVQEERGKFYASVRTLNASTIAVGDTVEEAFANWANRTSYVPALKI